MEICASSQPVFPAHLQQRVNKANLSEEQWDALAARVADHMPNLYTLECVPRKTRWHCFHILPCGLLPTLLTLSGCHFLFSVGFFCLSFFCLSFTFCFFSLSSTFDWVSAFRLSSSTLPTAAQWQLVLQNESLRYVHRELEWSWPTVVQNRCAVYNLECESLEGAPARTSHPTFHSRKISITRPKVATSEIANSICSLLSQPSRLAELRCVRPFLATSGTHNAYVER